MCRLLDTTNVALSSPILVTLMMDALSSSETSVLTRGARRNITEDCILRSHRRENLNTYIGIYNFPDVIQHCYPLLVDSVVYFKQYNRRNELPS
jgi:hypothetical protein